MNIKTLSEIVGATFLKEVRKRIRERRKRFRDRCKKLTRDAGLAFTDTHRKHSMETRQRSKQ